MFKLMFVIFGFLICSSLSAESIKPEIPINISSVKTELANEKLVRIIEFNIASEPKIIIEMLTRPRKKVIARRVIKSVEYMGKVLDFLKSAGTSFESTKVTGDKIIIDIFYVYPGKGGGALDLKCTVKVNNDKFSKPKCVEIESQN